MSSKGVFKKPSGAEYRKRRAEKELGKFSSYIFYFIGVTRCKLIPDDRGIL
jgi:hypothetical protein